MISTKQFPISHTSAVNGTTYVVNLWYMCRKPPSDRTDNNSFLGDFVKFFVPWNRYMQVYYHCYNIYDRVVSLYMSTWRPRTIFFFYSFSFSFSSSIPLPCSSPLTPYLRPQSLFSLSFFSCPVSPLHLQSFEDLIISSSSSSSSLLSYRPSFTSRPRNLGLEILQH